MLARDPQTRVSRCKSAEIGSKAPGSQKRKRRSGIQPGVSLRAEPADLIEGRHVGGSEAEDRFKLIQGLLVTVLLDIREAQIHVRIGRARVEALFQAVDNIKYRAILMTNYVNGKPGNTFELVEVHEQDFEPALFEMPDGYKKKSLSFDGAFSQPAGK